MSTFELTDCERDGICSQPETKKFVSDLRSEGHGYKFIWRLLQLKDAGVSRLQVQQHCAHVERTVMTNLGEQEDQTEEVTLDWFTKNGIELPPGFVFGTIEVRVGDKKHWLRVKPQAPEGEEEARVEIRQATPTVIDAPRPFPLVHLLGTWKTWITTPDLQCGFWTDRQNWHTIHDERAVDLTHQIGACVAGDEGLDGWLDVGDFLDLSALSTHESGPGDLQVECLNKSFQRGNDILTTRRHLVGPEGRLVVLGGNHDVRMTKMTARQMPYLVGLHRADDPEDEAPVLSVPYMCRFRDHQVMWCPSWPGGFYQLNTNLVAFHAPAYGNKVLDTARKISSLVHASVVFGHTHRREALAHNISTSQGTRTMEIWSDGTLARQDGSVPSSKSTYDENMNRLIQTQMKPGTGLLSEDWHVGFSVVHVEKDGRERFSREPIVVWDAWAQWRGQTFEATCDVEGNPVVEANAA